MASPWARSRAVRRSPGRHEDRWTSRCSSPGPRPIRRRLPALARALDPAGRLWVAWPKKAADVESDLTFGIVQGHGLDAGLVDNKSASIDDVYQGLQFVYRLKDRPRRRPDPAS